MTAPRTPRDFERDPFLRDPSYDPTSQTPYHPSKDYFPEFHQSTNEPTPIPEEVEVEERAAARREGREYVPPAGASVAEERGTRPADVPMPQSPGTPQGERPADVPTPSNPGTPQGERPRDVVGAPERPTGTPDGSGPVVQGDTSAGQTPPRANVKGPEAFGLGSIGRAEERSAADNQPGSKDSDEPRPTPEGERTPLIRGQPISGALQGVSPNEVPVADPDESGPRATSERPTGI